jgi:hypothetical protein
MAVLAFGGVFLLGNTLGGGGGGGASASKVVVAKTDIPLRHIIVDSDLDFANATAVGPVYANKADVITKISQIKITKGSVITGDMLATDINIVPGGAAPAYLPLPSGYVAMTVIASASVTIFNTAAAAPPGPPKVVSKTVFKDLRVIGLGPASASITPAGGTAAGGSAAPTTGVTSSLTIVLSQCDAEYFTWFLNNMSLRYTLQSYKDYLKTPLGDNSDPNCKNISDASGVTQYKVDARYKFTST